MWHFKFFFTFFEKIEKRLSTFSGSQSLYEVGARLGLFGNSRLRTVLLTQLMVWR
jgi:hypothetical protein